MIYPLSGVSIERQGLRKEAIAPIIPAVLAVGARVAPYAIKAAGWGLKALGWGAKAVKAAAPVAKTVANSAVKGAKFAGKAVGQAGQQFSNVGSALKAGNVGQAAKSAWQGTKTTINAGEHALRPITNQINGAANTLVNKGGFVNKTMGYGLKGVNEFGVKMMTPKNIAIGYGLDKGLEAGLNAAGSGAVEEAAQQIPQQAGNMVRRAPNRTAYSMIRKGVNNVPR